MRRRAETRVLRKIVVTSLLGLGAACATGDDALTVSDLDGHPQRPLSVTDAAAHVLVFLSPDCPIANSYAPELASLIAEHREDPIHFFFVYVDPEITAAQARQHRNEYGLPGTIVLDPDQRLVRATGVTVTPEAVVVLPDERLAYRGRIDDSWADVGRRRPSPQHRDLRDALRSVLRGEEVPTPRTTAVGCVISAR